MCSDRSTEQSSMNFAGAEQIYQLVIYRKSMINPTDLPTRKL
uniref:Uncharacterized protein n=1 Tax=Arundo donax TaxID=35708 RepID=A0A0A9A6H0_ARUDO